MDALFTKLLDMFSLEYMFSVIIGTYMVIKVVDFLNGDKIVPSWAKCLITFLVGAVVLVLFYIYTDETFECLVSSFFASLFTYDKAIKILVNKLDIGYRKHVNINQTGK